MRHFFFFSFSFSVSSFICQLSALCVRRHNVYVFFFPAHQILSRPLLSSSPVAPWHQTFFLCRTKKSIWFNGSLQPLRLMYVGSLCRKRHCRRFHLPVRRIQSIIDPSYRFVRFYCVWRGPWRSWIGGKCKSQRLTGRLVRKFPPKNEYWKKTIFFSSLIACLLARTLHTMITQRALQIPAFLTYLIILAWAAMQQLLWVSCRPRSFTARPVSCKQPTVGNTLKHLHSDQS